MALHMSKGDGETSYSQNSGVQKTLQDKAVVPYLREPLATLRLPAKIDAPVVVADLGCSSGPNAITLVSEVIKQIRELHCKINGKKSLPFQAFFNDLPTNDFNTIFQLLSSSDVKRSDFFAAGVPGSFYGPLFPPSTVHVFVSCCAMHYLSQIPSSVTDKSSPAFSNRGWYVTGPVPSKETVKACREQYAKDIDMFLKLRTNELVPGGLMLLALTSCWDPDSQGRGKLDANHAAMRQFDAAVEELVQEGVLTEDQRDLYNIPVFFPSFADIEEVLHKHDSELELVTMKEVNHKLFADCTDGSPHEIVKCVFTMYQGAAFDTTVRQFGKQGADLFWERLEKKLAANVQTLTGDAPTMLLFLRKKN